MASLDGFKLNLDSLEGTNFEIWTQKVQFEWFSFSFIYNYKKMKWGQSFFGGWDGDDPRLNLCSVLKYNEQT